MCPVSRGEVDLSRYRESEIAALHAVGPTAMKILKDTMKAKGLRFYQKH